MGHAGEPAIHVGLWGDPDEDRLALRSGGADAHGSDGVGQCPIVFARCLAEVHMDVSAYVSVAKRSVDVV